MKTRKTKVVALRLDLSKFNEIKGLADKYDVTESQVIRWALDALLRHEKKSGKLTLPLDFSENDDEK